SGIFAHGQRVIAVSRAHKQVVVVYAVMFKPRLSYSALAFATTGQNDGGVFMAFLPHAQKRGGRVVARVMQTRVKVGFPAVRLTKRAAVVVQGHCAVKVTDKGVLHCGCSRVVLKGVV